MYRDLSILYSMGMYIIHICIPMEIHISDFKSIDLKRERERER